MKLASEIKKNHLEEIKHFFKDYIESGKEITLKCPEADAYAFFKLTKNGLYTDGYAELRSSDGLELEHTTFTDKSMMKLYSTEIFYKHLAYWLACEMLNSIKE